MKNHFTQVEVAKKIGVSSSTYRDWEYGRKVPANYIQSLAEALNASLEDLIGKKNKEAGDMNHAISLIEKGLSLLKKM